MDRSKVLYGHRTQTYGETNYLDEKTEFWTEPRYCMVLGLKPMGKQTTYQNQVLDRTKVLHGPRTQTYGETNYVDEKTKFWTEPRYCIVLGFKPMGKPTT